MKSKPLSRFQAFVIHLAASGIVAAISLLLVFQIWHPGAIATLHGVTSIVALLIFVDFILGPSLTAIVYSPQKPPKERRLDLSIIVIFQLAALVFGLQSIFSARPAYIVFNVDRFSIVAANELVTESLQKAKANGHDGPGWFGPQFVAAELPEDAQEKLLMSLDAASGGADLPQYPEYYRTLDSQQAQIIEKLRPLQELRKLNGLDDQKWAEWLKTVPKEPTALGYLPVEGHSSDGIAIIQRETGEVLSISRLLPAWSPPAEK